MTFVATRLRSRSAAIASTIALAVGGCSGATDKDATGDPPPGTAEPRTFTSERHGFQVAIPAGWRVNEAYLDWDMGTEPHRGVPSLDTLRSEISDPWVVIGQQEMPDGVTLKRWIAKLRASDTITYPNLCEAPEFERAGSLGGEPAHVVALRCPADFPDSIAILVLGFHGGSGYLAMCFSEETAEGRIDVLLRHCNTWLSSFRFVDEPSGGAD